MLKEECVCVSGWDGWEAGGDEGGGRAHQQVFLGRPTGYAGTVGGKSCVVKAFIL